jgi:hypothetical protein
MQSGTLVDPEDEGDQCLPRLPTLNKCSSSPVKSCPLPDASKQAVHHSHECVVASTGPDKGAAPNHHHHEKRRRSSSSSSGIVTSCGGAECDVSLATNEENSFSFGVTTINDMMANSAGENSPLALTAASVIPNLANDRRPSDPYCSTSLRDANPQTPNIVVAAVAASRGASSLPLPQPAVADVSPWQLPRPGGASTAPTPSHSQQNHQESEGENMSTTTCATNQCATLSPAADDGPLARSAGSSSSPQCRHDTSNAVGDTTNGNDDGGASCDEVDLCFPSMGGDAAEGTLMFLPTVGSSESHFQPSSTGNDHPPLQTTTSDEFSPIPPQPSGDDGNNEEQRIIVDAVGSYRRDSGAWALDQKAQPRRSNSSTTSQPQQPASLWRELHDHLLEPSLRLFNSSLIDGSSSMANSTVQHGSPSGLRSAATSVTGARPTLTLHHLRAHALHDRVDRSRSSSMSGESFEDPPLAMSPRYYGSDDDGTISSRAGSSVAYGLCGGSSHSSLFDTPQELLSIGTATATTPPLSPPYVMSTVSPRTTRLQRGGPGFGSVTTPGVGARYGHIPHASTMFPAVSPLEGEEHE